MLKEVGPELVNIVSQYSGQIVIWAWKFVCNAWGNRGLTLNEISDVNWLYWINILNGWWKKNKTRNNICAVGQMELALICPKKGKKRDNK